MSLSSPMQNLPAMESGLDAGHPGAAHESGEVVGATNGDQVTSEDDVIQTPDPFNMSIVQEDSEMPDWEDIWEDVSEQETEAGVSESVQMEALEAASLAIESGASFITTGSGITYHAGDALPGSTFELVTRQPRHIHLPALIPPTPQRVSSFLSSSHHLGEPIPSSRRPLVPIIADYTMTDAPDASPDSHVAGSGMGDQKKSEGLPFPRVATDPSLADLREISSMASWKVSSSKPGCGVDALRNPTTATFWQSDGPQPHFLNVHFIKMVHIVKLRIYLDYELDESYTPTRISFCAGTHDYDAVEFAEWRWHDAGPKGWIDVDLSQCGSEDDHRALVEQYGNDADALRGKGVLHCMFLQVRVLENHQNGKDTHIRGVQVFARDERLARHNPPFAKPGTADARIERLRQELEEAEWMKEPVIR